MWNPCTQMKIQQSQSIIPIKRGEGVWLFDYDDKKYLDATSQTPSPRLIGIID